MLRVDLEDIVGAPMTSRKDPRIRLVSIPTNLQHVVAAIVSWSRTALGTLNSGGRAARFTQISADPPPGMLAWIPTDNHTLSAGSWQQSRSRRVLVARDKERLIVIHPERRAERTRRFSIVGALILAVMTSCARSSSATSTEIRSELDGSQGFAPSDSSGADRAARRTGHQPGRHSPPRGPCNRPDRLLVSCRQLDDAEKRVMP